MSRRIMPKYQYRGLAIPPFRPIGIEHKIIAIKEIRGWKQFSRKQKKMQRIDPIAKEIFVNMYTNVWDPIRIIFRLRAEQLIK